MGGTDGLTTYRPSPYLLLECLQGFKLQPGQFGLDVFGHIWDDKGQDELQCQQAVLKAKTQTKGKCSTITLHINRWKQVSHVSGCIARGLRQSEPLPAHISSK